MSLLSIANSAAAALPTVNIHPHGHRHSSDNTAGQVPVTTAQNLFGSLLQTLEQTVGLQTGATPSSSASPTSTTATPPASSAAAATALSATTATVNSAATAASKAAHSADNSLQNYLSRLSQYIKKEGAPLHGFIGSNFDVKV
jgi:hypothetical protein